MITKTTKFILDGSNIAIENGKPDLDRILYTIKELDKYGEYIIIFSHEFYFRLKEKQKIRYKILKKKFNFYESPKGTDCDLFILETAELLDAIPVSNDSFSGYNQYKERISKKLAFLIIGNHCIIPGLRNHDKINHLKEIDQTV